MYGNQGYPPPQHGYPPSGQGFGAPPGPPYPPRGTNSMAIASVIAVVLAWFGVLPVVGAIAAVIFGHVARGQIRRTGEEGDTLATVGLIAGYAHLLLACCGVGAYIALVLGILGMAGLGAAAG